MDAFGFGILTRDRLLVVNEFPRPNQKLVAKAWHEQPGGPVAVGLLTMARLGLRVQWGLPLSYGGQWEPVAKYFDAAGVQFQRQNVSNELSEATILVEKSSGARTVILQERTGDLANQFEQVRAQLDKAEWVYVDGRDPLLTRAAKQWARQQEASVYLDMGSLRPHWQEAVRDCDVVIISDEVMRLLDSQLTPPAMLRRLADYGVEIAGMTMGREGSIFWRDGDIFSFPAAAAERVVDTTNAGDVFHGAFLAAWIKTQSLTHSARFASRCAAWAVGEFGHNLLEFPASLRTEFDSLASIQKQ